MRTLFIGGTKRGYLTVKALVESGAEIAGILSLKQDEHERERYEHPLRALATKNGIPFRETKWIKKEEIADWIEQDVRPELGIVVGCRVLLPKEIYEMPRRGTVAVHDSLLPLNRGFAPLNWSIINGQDHTGVTLFYINEGMDAGDVVGQKRVEIGPTETAPQVYDRVCQATVDLVLETYPRLAANTARAVTQDESLATFLCSRSPIDGLIDWSSDTVHIYNQIRGLTYPYPGAFTYYAGKKLVVWRAEAIEAPPAFVGRIPGRVIEVNKQYGTIDVLTRDGVLRIFEVDYDGRGTIAAAQVVTSVRVALGLRQSDLLARIEALEAQVASLSSLEGENRVAS
jgi:methionyl-tRNA formyltransferase